MVGSAIRATLSQKEYEVRYLTTSHKQSIEDPLAFYWNVEKSEIDSSSMTDIDHLINLSGASIGRGLWTTKRKSTLYNSRIQGTDLLLRSLESSNGHLQSYFGASAVGYYGIEKKESVGGIGAGE